VHALSVEARLVHVELRGDGLEDLFGKLLGQIEGGGPIGGVLTGIGFGLGEAAGAQQGMQDEVEILSCLLYTSPSPRH